MYRCHHPPWVGTALGAGGMAPIVAEPHSVLLSLVERQTSRSQCPSEALSSAEEVRLQEEEGGELLFQMTWTSEEGLVEQGPRWVSERPCSVQGQAL